MLKHNSENPKFRIVSMDERLQVDPRGSVPLTSLSDGRFIVKATYGGPIIEEVPIDPVGSANELLEAARSAAIEPRGLGEEI